MKGNSISRFSAVVLAFAIAACFAPSLASAETLPVQAIRRFSANYILFDGSEASASSSQTTGNPVNFYTHDVIVPRDVNVLYVTITAVSDAHDGAQTLLNCQLDGQNCNNHGPASNGAPAGWVKVLNPAGDLHDNSVAYEWCVPIAPIQHTPKPLRHTVSLNLASTGQGNVYIEQAHIFIDGSNIGNAADACADADTATDGGD